MQIEDGQNTIACKSRTDKIRYQQNQTGPTLLILNSHASPVYWIHGIQMDQIFSNYPFRKWVHSISPINFG